MVAKISLKYSSKSDRFNSMLTNIREMGLYNPASSDITLEALASFRDKLNVANKNVIEANIATKKARDSRKFAYADGESSVDTIFKGINTAVQSQYGKPSTQHSLIDSLLNQMKYKTSVVEPKVANTSENSENESISKTYHYGDRSFGIKLETLNGCITTLSSFGNYLPGNPNLTIDFLTSKVNVVSELNSAVIVKRFEERQLRKARADLYVDLSIRYKKIKTHISTVYGKNSLQYQIISSYAL